MKELSEQGQRQELPVEVRDRLNILFVQDQPCIRNYKEACALKKLGHSVALAYSRGRLSERYALPDSTYSGCYKLDTPSDLQQLSRRFDVVHCHNEPDLWTTIALSFDTPVIHDTHDLLTLREPNDPGVRFLESVANRGAAGRIYVSEFLLQIARSEYQVEAKTSIVLPNYVTKGQLPRSLLRKLSAGDGQVHVVYAGGVVDRTDSHRFLLEPFQQITDSGLNLHLYPPNRVERYEQMGEKNSRFFCHRTVSPETLLTELCRYDFGLIVFNQIPEKMRHLDSALPNKLFEYLAAGLPVIGPENQGLSRFINETGCGVVYSRPEEIASKLSGYRQRRDVRDLCPTMEEVIPLLGRLYADVIAGNRKR